jgi:hypothetical protein
MTEKEGRRRARGEKSVLLSKNERRVRETRNSGGGAQPLVGKTAAISTQNTKFI